MKDQLIELVTITTTKDEDGFPEAEAEIKIQAYAEKKSVRQSEFYAAKAIDMNLELVFEMWFWEYDGQTLLDHEGKRYKIERTYSKDTENIELVCTAARG